MFRFPTPVVTRLLRQITSRLPGRPEMYTAARAHVKALHLVSAFVEFWSVEVAG
jgi:hypothetical protein